MSRGAARRTATPVLLRLPELREVGEEVAQVFWREVVSEAGGHEGADELALRDISLRDGVLGAGGIAEDELGVVACDDDPDQFVAFLRRQPHRLKALLHLALWLQHRADDELQWLRAADGIESRTH